MKMYWLDILSHLVQHINMCASKASVPACEIKEEWSDARKTMAVLGALPQIVKLGKKSNQVVSYILQVLPENTVVSSITPTKTDPPCLQKVDSVDSDCLSYVGHVDGLPLFCIEDVIEAIFFIVGGLLSI